MKPHSQIDIPLCLVEPRQCELNCLAGNNYLWFATQNKRSRERPISGINHDLFIPIFPKMETVFTVVGISRSSVGGILFVVCGEWFSGTKVLPPFAHIIISMRWQRVPKQRHKIVRLTLGWLSWSLLEGLRGRTLLATPQSIIINHWI